jgi:hypothetical protein
MDATAARKAYARKFAKKPMPVPNGANHPVPGIMNDMNSNSILLCCFNISYTIEMNQGTL